MLRIDDMQRQAVDFLLGSDIISMKAMLLSAQAEYFIIRKDYFILHSNISFNVEKIIL